MSGNGRGWRLWGVTPAGLVAPFHEGAPTGCEPIDGVVTPPARCNLAEHDAPAVDCSCGWYYSTSPDSVTAPPGYVLVFAALHDEPRAITRVAGLGRILPDGTEGVPGVWRAERLQIRGPLYLNTPAQPFAEALAGCGYAVAPNGLRGLP